MDFVNKRSFFSFKENRFPCHLLLLVVLWQVPLCLWGVRRIDIVLTGSQDCQDKGKKDVLISV